MSFSKISWTTLLIGLFCIVACKPEPPVITEPPVTLNKEIKVIQDEFQGTPIVIAGSHGQNFIVSYQRVMPDGTELQFETVQNKTLPAMMQDNEGNIWDMFGNAIEGPRAGQQLPLLNSYMGYWFSFGAFFPGAEIYNDNQSLPSFMNPEGSNGWLIPSENIYAGAGRDGIPSLELPTIDEYQERNYLEESNPFYLDDDALVIGIKVGDQYRVYPHAILDWHEIVNDTISGEAVSIIYCPLTGTGMAWSRMVNGVETTFGVSGLLFNNNIIPYDRFSESNWSQMRGECVQGTWSQTEAEPYQVVETNWGTWRSMFKAVPILSNKTQYARDYGEFPYGDYRTNDDFMAFPLTYDDDRLPRKERVHGVVLNGTAKVYRLQDF